MPYTIRDCDYILNQARDIFQPVRTQWINQGEWAAPHRTMWLYNKNNQRQPKVKHIFDTTHIKALQSLIGGFRSYSTPSSRYWFQIRTGEEDIDNRAINNRWLYHFTLRCHFHLNISNFYNANIPLFGDLFVFSNGAQKLQETPNDGLFYHDLAPGSYYLVNDSFGKPVIMAREFSLSIRGIVERFGKKVDGSWDWSNFSNYVMNSYDRSEYSNRVNVV